MTIPLAETRLCRPGGNDQHQALGLSRNRSAWHHNFLLAASTSNRWFAGRTLPPLALFLCILSAILLVEGERLGINRRSVRVRHWARRRRRRSARGWHGLGVAPASMSASAQPLPLPVSRQAAFGQNRTLTKVGRMTDMGAKAPPPSGAECRVPGLPPGYAPFNGR